MKTFAITGLPRSGSAWVSQVMSGSDCACVHEGLSWNAALLNDLRSTPPKGLRYLGFSDTSIHLRPLGTIPPTAPLMVLARPAIEVQRSLALKGLEVGAEPLQEAWELILRTFIHHPGPVKIVQFSNLFSPNTILSIRSFLATGAHFPPTSHLSLPLLRISDTRL